MNESELFLLSHPHQLKNEAAMISEILGSLPFLTLQLRKPDWDVKEIASLLEKIPAVFHQRIVAHYFPQLLESFRLKGWHFSPARPAESSTKPVSASVHSLEELREFVPHYTYLFCSPLFDSISKPGYRATEWNISGESDSVKNKAVALGGISELTIPVARNRGFHNFAVLGSVWNSPDPVSSAKQLSKLILPDEN